MKTHTDRFDSSIMDRKALTIRIAQETLDTIIECIHMYTYFVDDS